MQHHLRLRLVCRRRQNLRRVERRSTHVKDLKPMKGVSVKNWHFMATTPVGDGFVDNMALAKLLKAANYKGFLAVELDFLHPDYNDDEDSAVARSVTELRRIAQAVG